MFGRTTIFGGILSGTIVALALLVQATNFGRATLWFVLALTPVTLFIGIVTFIRSVAINFEDARWVAGMDLLRRADVSALMRAPPVATASIGAVIAILSGLAHVQYAARFRRRHTPPA